MSESFLNDRVMLHCGDCLDVLATLDANSLDSCVTDPPYHLTSIVKRFGADNAAPVKNQTTVIGKAYGNLSRGFMGRTWDGGDIAFRPETWAAIYRVLKPGAHMLVFGGTRTFARMSVAIEDAGFEIRDTLAWLYGSGFPKSHDVSKGIDRAAGAEREIVGPSLIHSRGDATSFPKRPGEKTAAESGRIAEQTAERAFITAPATDAARQWEGWGTALKPAMELIVLARKPLSEGTVAANVLRWGTGAINVDGCRVQTADDLVRPQVDTSAWHGNSWSGKPQHIRTDVAPLPKDMGRWPANLIHDGSDEVIAAFPDTVNGGNLNCANIASENQIYGQRPKELSAVYGRDTGSAARFFYTAKADSDDRLGSKHPTVKPLDLMQYLVRLITPKGGTCIDPFAGTGTTGEAAWREGANAVLIEREAEYQADIRRRMALCLAGPDERGRESIKAKNLPRDDGPLFEYDGQKDGRDSYYEGIRAIKERVANGGEGWKPK